MSTENLYQKGNDEHSTPDWIIKGMFRDFYDPCPLSQGLVKRDGLESEWKGDRIFINPPYSNPLPWVERAIEESKKGKTVVLLLKHDSSTKWYSKLHEARARFLPITGRLAFNGKVAPFPNVLVVLYGNEVLKNEK